ncbi:MAG: sulfatase family protein [Luteolibacter sp.]
MPPKLPVRTVLAVLLLMQAVDPCHAADAPDLPAAPNIVLILADDFGVGDIRAHYPDNKIATPHLDRLAAGGMSFTDAHSASAVCTPTRYGLMTGRYCWRTRLQEWVLAAYEPPLISSARPTLPGYLRQHGYRTACIGKWHLGWNWPGPQPGRMDERPNILATSRWDFTKPIEDGPTTRGFDHYFGTDVPNFPPFTFIENDRVVEHPTAAYMPHPEDGVALPAKFNGCPMAPGWRMTEILPTLTGRAVKYVHEQAKTKRPFFLFFSMTSPHDPVSPSERFRGRSGIAPIADFVMETDWSVGQVIRAVDDAGIADNTLILFTADNGHSARSGWNELIKAGHRPSGEFRGRKADIWEGGHRVPLIVRWPGRVPPGSRSGQLLCLNDVMATCAEVLGDELPPDAAPDSFSILKTMLGKTDKPFRPNLVSHSVHGEFAFREGPWKLVFRLPGAKDKSRGKRTVAELYDLEEDVAETRDLAAAEPQVVKHLTEGLREVVDRGRSRPGPGQPNDTRVRFDIVQTERWAPPLPQQ